MKLLTVHFPTPFCCFLSLGQNMLRATSLKHNLYYFLRLRDKIEVFVLQVIFQSVGLTWVIDDTKNYVVFRRKLLTTSPNTIVCNPGGNIHRP
jgi:hypothetical protein